MSNRESLEELSVGEVDEVSCTAELEESDITFENKFKRRLACSAQSQSLELVRSVFGLFAGSNDPTFIYSI